MFKLYKTIMLGIALTATTQVQTAHWASKLAMRASKIAVFSGVIHTGLTIYDSNPNSHDKLDPLDLVEHPTIDAQRALNPTKALEEKYPRFTVRKAYDSCGVEVRDKILLVGEKAVPNLLATHTNRDQIYVKALVKVEERRNADYYRHKQDALKISADSIWWTALFMGTEKFRNPSSVETPSGPQEVKPVKVPFGQKFLKAVKRSPRFLSVFGVGLGVSYLMGKQIKELHEQATLYRYVDKGGSHD